MKEDFVLGHKEKPRKSYKAPPKTYPKDGKRNSLKATSTA